MAAIVGAEIMVDRFISNDPDNGLLATANSDATVSNIITRSLATGDVTLSAPANSTGTNTRRWLLDRPIVTTSTIDVSGAATFSSTVAVTGAVTLTTVLKANDHLGTPRDVIRMNASIYAVEIGGASATGAGFAPMIYRDTAANLAPAGASYNGLMAIDTTNNRLCYWSGGLRYYIAGTSF